MSGNDRLAAEVRAEAARQRISARGLAEKMGEPPSTVARKLRAETAMTLDEIEAFAKALGVTVVDLVARAYAAPIPTGPQGGTQPPVPKVSPRSLVAAVTQRRPSSKGVVTAKSSPTWASTSVAA